MSGGHSLARWLHPGVQHVARLGSPVEDLESYHTVGRLGTSSNFASWVMRGTPSTKAVAAMTRAAGPRGNTPPSPPARAAPSSVTGWMVSRANWRRPGSHSLTDVL